MERVLDLSADDLRDERVGSATEDVHFPEALARSIIETYSAPGDVVLDPFAGYGTTLVMSEQLGRRPVGIELLPERAALIRERLRSDARVITGDARQLDSFDIGLIDLCFTSPPYMSALEHPQNPMTGYATLDGAYATYHSELAVVFQGVKRCLRPGGYLVINAANIRTGDAVTTLAWDLTHQLRKHLSFCGEIYLKWDRPLSFISGDYCLVFRR